MICQGDTDDGTITCPYCGVPLPHVLQVSHEPGSVAMCGRCGTLLIMDCRTGGWRAMTEHEEAHWIDKLAEVWAWVNLSRELSGGDYWC
jgi:hypothetical protein